MILIINTSGNGIDLVLDNKSMHFDAEKQAITRFLKTGELPKSLAENPEMCIIYG